MFNKRLIHELVQLSHGRVVLNSYSVSPYTKYLSFNIIFQRNNLVFLRHYSERQTKLHRIIVKLYEKHNLGFKEIADKFNKLGIKTPRGKTFSSASIHSILKRKKERDKWIKEVRNKRYPLKIVNFALS